MAAMSYISEDVNIEDSIIMITATYGGDTWGADESWVIRFSVAKCQKCPKLRNYIRIRRGTQIKNLEAMLENKTVSESTEYS